MSITSPVQSGPMIQSNGQLLEHAICLVVLFFCHFIVLLLFLNEINGDRDDPRRQSTPGVPEVC